MPLPPSIGVILPIHNGERFLDETLRSLLAQDFTDFEAVAIIDGTHDESQAILERHADPRLRVIWQENRGAATAISTGLAATSSHWIAFLDQDDVWAPMKLRRHAEVMAANPAVALTFSWFRVIDAHSRDIGIHSSRVTGTVPFQDLLADFVIGGTSNVVVRRDALLRANGADPAIPNMYDLDLFLRIALQSPSNILAIPEELMAYRRHPAQITRNVPVLEAEWDHTLQKLRNLAPAQVAAVERLAAANMHRYFARLGYESDAHADALRQLARGFALRQLPFLTDPRTWITLAACLCGLVLPRPLLRLAERSAGIHRD